MKISEAGKRLIVQLEGIQSTVYHDSAGLPTIGVGHLLTRSELSSGKIIVSGMMRIRYKDGITYDQAMGLLSQDLMRFEAVVNEGIYSKLTQHQFDALVSFSFNIGDMAFMCSTLRKRVNDSGDLDSVPAQMRRWVYAGGKTVEGLKNRREMEIVMWEGRET